MATVLENKTTDPRIVAFAIRVLSRRPGVGSGRGARGRAIRVACRGKVCGPRGRLRVGMCILTVNSDPRKYKRRPGGVARKPKAGKTGVVTSS